MNRGSYGWRPSTQTCERIREDETPKADVENMPSRRRWSPQGQVDDWIDRLVENAPALTDVQVNRLQAVLVTAQDR